MRQFLHNAIVVDVQAGRACPATTLLVEEDRLVAVGRAADFGQPTETDTEFDLEGAYVVPGFVDPHVHLALSARPDALDRVDSDLELASRNAHALLLSGVTTAADCGGLGQLTLDLKHAIGRGAVCGPRLLVSLNPITTPAGHCHSFGALAYDVASARRATRELIARGADFVKVIASGGGTRGGTPPTEPQFSQTALEAIVDEAHTAGRRVAAHARAAEAIRRAVRAGVDRLEHLTWEIQVGLSTTLSSRTTWVDTVYGRTSAKVTPTAGGPVAVQTAERVAARAPAAV